MTCPSGSDRCPVEREDRDFLGVIAGTTIPRGATVGPLKGPFSIGQFPTEAGDDRRPVKVYFKSGSMASIDIPDNSWTTFIQAARDRHEQNAEVYNTSDGYVYIRTIRDLKDCEYVFVWYEDALAIETNIPFLTLANIRGSQAYECSACRQTYQYPNPLKAHIRFTCQQANTETPPFKLEPLLSTADILKTRHIGSRGSVSNDSFVVQRPVKRYIDQQTNSRRGHNHESYRPLNRSAFTSCGKSPESSPPILVGNSYSYSYQNEDMCGYRREISAHSGIHPRLGPLEPNYDCQLTCGVTNSPYCSPYKLKASISLRSAIDCAVSLEQNQIKYPEHCIWGGRSDKQFTHKSNNDKMTTFPMPSEMDGEPIDVLHRSYLAMSSKKGHLCIYCGKFYSRKYGLKIHLRTHTGYKPLKCKVCFRAFGDPSNLNKHIRLHAEGETPYKCDICGKVLVRRRDLTRHVKSRHPNVTVEADDEHSDAAD